MKHPIVFVWTAALAAVGLLTAGAGFYYVSLAGPPAPAPAPPSPLPPPYQGQAPTTGNTPATGQAPVISPPADSLEGEALVVVLETSTLHPRDPSLVVQLDKIVTAQGKKLLGG